MAFVRPQLTAPGVYVQEVPSGDRAIIGVPTSITVFAGRTKWGPVNTPTHVFSFADFQAKFGGLMLDSPLTYCVNDFFLNGGAHAILLRLFEGDPTASTGSIAAWSDPNGKLKADPANVTLAAASPGSWSKAVTWFSDRNGIDDNVAAAVSTPTWTATKSDLFNLTIRFDQGRGQIATEVFRNVTLNPAGGSRHLSLALQGSQYVRFQAAPAATPAATGGGGSSSASGGSGTTPAPNPPASSGGSAADSKKLTATTYTDAFPKLDSVEIFNLMVIPPDQRDPASYETGEADWALDVYPDAVELCKARKATLIIDSPQSWNDVSKVMNVNPATFATQLGISVGDEAARYAAIYFPRVTKADPLLNGSPHTFPAAGVIAGVIARTDQSRGVWKAPAGFEAGLTGVSDVTYSLNDQECGWLNQQGVNCLRTFSATGPLIWGARTSRGADQLADDYKYLPVRRLADFIEQTLLQQTRWAVFEPNDEPLWSQLRTSIGAFMADLFRQGAFQGSSRDKAYFVKCDASTTLQSDIDAGIVNVQIGFAPLKPAEFVVLYLQQMAAVPA
jgi:phage tail sheath protein FI